MFLRNFKLVKIINKNMEINYWEIIKNMLPIIWNLWPLWLLGILAIIIRIMFEIVIPREIDDFKSIIRFRKGLKWRKDRDLLIWLRGLSPKEFEGYISALFFKMGYDTKVVGGSYDGGIDVIAKKDRINYYIQCKKYISSKVGVRDVRDFYGAIADRLSEGKAYFITTNIFTLEAERYAKDKPIELVDGYKLIKYIKSVGENINIGTKEEKINNSDVENNNCSNCNGKLIERKGKFGKFYGCSNYPRCKYTKEIN